MSQKTLVEDFMLGNPNAQRIVLKKTLVKVPFVGTRFPTNICNQKMKKTLKFLKKHVFFCPTYWTFTSFLHDFSRNSKNLLTFIHSQMESLFCYFVKKKKKRENPWMFLNLFFSSHLKKFVLGGCFGSLFHHYDSRCFLSLCKKHCSLFVKQKRGLTDAFFFTTMIYIVFCSVKNTAVCLWKKKDLFFFLIWKSLFWVDALDPFFTTMIYVVFCHFAKNTAVCLWNKKEDLRIPFFFFFIWKSLFWVDALEPFFLPQWFTLFFVL